MVAFAKTSGIGFEIYLFVIQIKARCARVKFQVSWQLASEWVNYIQLVGELYDESIDCISVSGSGISGCRHGRCVGRVTCGSETGV